MGTGRCAWWWGAKAQPHVEWAAKCWYIQMARLLGTVGGGEMENRVIAEARKAMQDGQSRMLEYSMTDPTRGDPGVCGGQVEVYVEPLRPRPTLVVIGAGHVGKAVVHLAKWLGFLCGGE